MKLVNVTVMLVVGFCLSLHAQPRCTNASLNGTLFYMISGSIKSGTAVSYAELGQVVADGAGNFSSGSSTTSTAGAIVTTTLTVPGSTYTVHADCSGTATLITSAQSFTVNFQIVNGGGLTLSSVTSSANNELGQVRFYRAANATGSQCGNGSLSGAYGVLASGGTYAGGVRTPYEAESQIVLDGKGGITSLAGQVTTVSANGPQGLSGTGVYSIAADCSGTAQVNLTNGHLSYTIARVEGGSVLFLENDPFTTVSGSGQPQLLQSILPQFVFGAGVWYSALYFSNPTSGTVSFPVTFSGNDGTPLVVPGVGSTKQVTIGPNDTEIIEAPNTLSFGIGYASVALPAGVTGYGVYRQSIAGRADQEALVGFKNATQTATSLIWDEATPGFATSVAIVNPSTTVDATVTITIWDSSANLIGTPQQLSVPAGNKVAPQLDTLPTFSGMVGKRGSALFSVTAGNLAVLGLRFIGGGAFTSIPTTQVQ